MSCRNMLLFGVCTDDCKFTCKKKQIQFLEGKNNNKTANKNRIQYFLIHRTGRSN